MTTSQIRNPILDDPNYRPDFLFGDLQQFFGVKSNARVADRLGADSAQISRLITKKEALTPGLMIRILDHTGWTIQDLRERVGMPFVDPNK